MLSFIQMIDRHIISNIQMNMRNEFLDSFFVSITKLGNWGFIWFAISIIFIIFNKKRLGTAIIASVISSYALTEIIKLMVGRTRPYLALIKVVSLIGTVSGQSFPSGHTATSFAASTVMLLNLNKKYGIAVLVLSILIGFSRVYDGVHYPSDVLAGAALGIAIGFAIDKLLFTRSKKKKLRERKN